MEKIMKRLFLSAALAGICALASAQDVSYALPFTSINIEVDAVKTTYFAGPYASYAKDLLNMDVQLIDRTYTEVTEIRIIPSLEADPWAPRLTCPAQAKELLELTAQGLISYGDPKADEAVWRFHPQQEGYFDKRTVYTPGKESSSAKRNVARTLESQAREAAEMIHNARKERLNISIGNTDASYSGEALSAALEELSRIEREYLLLFTGYTVTREFSANFEVLPSAGDRSHRYPAFKLTPDGMLVKDGEGIPYEILLTPASLPEVKAEPVETDVKKKPQAPLKTIHYRVPAICKLILMEDGMPLLETRIPVYQLGRECEMPINTK